MELNSLEHLLALEEHRHFGRAAAALGLSQPALTKSLQRLEKLLGARLVDRSNRGVHPTPIGEQVIRRARPLVGGWSELRREVDLLCGKQIGRLCVGVGPAMSESFVTAAIARLAEAHPQARIVARVDHWSQLSEWLCQGELDLFVADISHAQQGHELRIVPMPSEQLLWFCRSGHPLASSRRVTRKDLLDYPLVTPRMPIWARRWFAEAIGPQTARASDQAYAAVECESYSMLKRMVLESNCISAALQSTISNEITQGTLIALPIKAPALRTKAGIVSLQGRTLSPLAQAFVNEVVQGAAAMATDNA